jgi:hypothetical protein
MIRKMFKFGVRMTAISSLDSSVTSELEKTKKVGN